MMRHPLSFAWRISTRRLAGRLLLYAVGLYDLLLLGLALNAAIWLLLAPAPGVRMRFVAWRRRRLPWLDADRLMAHLRLYLSARAVTLGVALFVSSWIANDTLVEGFRASVATVASRADFQVSRGGAGLESAALPAVEALPGVAAVAPVVQAAVRVAGSDATVMLLGIDPRRDAQVRGYGAGLAPPEARELLAGLESLPEPQRALAAAALERALREGEITSLSEPPPGAAVPHGAWDALAAALTPEWLAAQPPALRPLFVSADFARAHGVRRGDTVTLSTALGPLPFLITAEVALAGAARTVSTDLAFTFLPVAQLLFGRQRKFDRLDVVLAPGAERDAVAASIRETLGAGVLIRAPDAAVSDLAKAVAGFRSVLAVSSLLTLLVGMFFIANTLAMEVLERSKEVGVLRSLGATRRQVQTLFLGEGALFGVVGSLVGLAAGWLLADLVLAVLFDSIGTLVAVARPERPAAAPGVFLAGLGIGVGTAVGAAWLPAHSATRVAPLEALRAHAYRSGLRETYRPAFAGGLALLAAAAVVIARPGLIGYYAGHLVMVLATLGVAGIAPQCAAWVCGLMRRLARRLLGFTPRLAADNLLAHPLRTAMTVVVVGLSLGMVIGVALMTGSLKRSLVDWMEVTFPADVVCTTTDQTTNVGSFNPRDESFGDRLRAEPGVDHVIALRFPQVPYQGETILLGAFDLAEYRKTAWMNVTDGPPKDELLAILTSRDAVVASENFRALHGLGRGDFVTLETLRGPRRFEIAALAQDYSWPKGFLVLERARYREYWQDPLVDCFDLAASAGQSIPALVARLQERYGGAGQLFIYPLDRYQQRLLGFIDQMYRLSYAQVLLAVVIGLFGIVVAVSISVMRRVREIGLLRAVGMTRRQVARLIVWESVMLAAVGGLLALVAGQCAYFPADLVFRAEAGFGLEYHFPTAAALAALAVALLAGLGASWWPARWAGGLSIPDAIGYE